MEPKRDLKWSTLSTYRDWENWNSQYDYASVYSSVNSSDFHRVTVAVLITWPMIVV